MSHVLQMSKIHLPDVNEHTKLTSLIYTCNIKSHYIPITLTKLSGLNVFILIGFPVLFLYIIPVILLYSIS